MRSALRTIGLYLFVVPQLVLAGAIRDDGNFLNAEAKASLEAKIAAIAASTQPAQRVTIVTKNKLGSDIQAEVKQAAPDASSQGLYIFMAREPRKLLVIPSKGNRSWLNHDRIAELRSDMLLHFRANEYAQGLEAGITRFAKLAGEQGTRPVAAAPLLREPAVSQPAASFDWTRLLTFIAIILGVAGLLRLLANLRRPRPSYPQRYDQPNRWQGGMQGGPNYGGGGGGWMQSMFGGIAGAMAGNWIYDKMFGNHTAYGQHHDQSPLASPPPHAGTDEQSGGWDYDHSGGDFSSSNDWGGSDSGDSSGSDW